MNPSKIILEFDFGFRNCNLYIINRIRFLDPYMKFNTLIHEFYLFFYIYTFDSFDIAASQRQNLFFHNIFPNIS